MARASDPALRQFSLDRVFAAARPLVYRVWTDPRYVRRWWGIEGSTNVRCEFDARVGAAWRIDMRTSDGTVYPNGGVFLEVVENERLVYSSVPVPESPAWGGKPPGPLLHTVCFADHAEGRTRVTMDVKASSAADCERLVRAGMRDGMVRGLDRLSALLAGLDEAA